MLCCVEFLQISRVTLDSFEWYRGTDPNSATKALNNRTGVGTIPRRQRRTLSVYESNVSWCPRRGGWGPWDLKKKKKKAHTLYIFRLKFFIFTGEFPHVRMNGSRANADTITRCLFDPRVSGQIESSIPLSPNEIWCGWVACSYFWCHLLSWSCSTAAEQRQRCHSYVG